jgi:hypothetical protein
MTQINTDETQNASGDRALLELIPQCIAFQFLTVLTEFSADVRLWLNDAEDF